jgi:hypothetical protein
MTTPKPITVAGFEIAIPGAGGRVRIIQWSGLSGRRYDFHWRPDTRRHTVRFTDREEFEKAYEDINHSTRRIPSGLGVFHVHFLSEEVARQLAEADARDRRENALNRCVVFLGAGQDPLDDPGLAADLEDFDPEVLLEEAAAIVAADQIRDARFAADRDRDEARRLANERPRQPVPVGVRTDRPRVAVADGEIPDVVIPASTSLGIGVPAETPETPPVEPPAATPAAKPATPETPPAKKAETPPVPVKADDSDPLDTKSEFDDDLKLD